MYVTLVEAKKQIVEDTTDNDAYITDLIAVAETTIENSINDKLENLEDLNHKIPTPLKHAILLLVGNLFANREPVSFSQPYKVPYTIEYLTDPYKNYAE